MTIIEGVITHQETHHWSETNIESSGGISYIGKDGGFIRHPQIISTTTKQMQTELWVKEDDGSEHHIRLTNHNFATTTNHRVRIAWGGSMANRQYGTYLFAYNFNSGVTVDFNWGSWTKWVKSRNLIKYPQNYILTIRSVPIIAGTIISITDNIITSAITPHDPPAALTFALMAAISLAIWAALETIGQLYFAIPWKNNVAITTRESILREFSR